MNRVLATALAAVLAIPTIVSAQMTWMAFSRLAEGKSGAEGMGLVMHEKPLMDGLVADGIINGWGIAVPATHRPADKANFLQWVAVDNWSKVDQWVGRTLANQQSMEPEEAESQMQAFMGTFEAGSHFDEVVRNAILRSAASPEDMEKTGVFYVSSYTAREGQGDAFVDLAKSQAVPIADRLVDEGIAIAYGMHVPEVHGVEGWTHRLWWALPNLEGIGKLKQAYSEAGDDLGSRVDELTVPGSHFDTVYISMFIDMAPAE